MEIDKETLIQQAKISGIPPEKAEALWQHLSANAKPPHRPMNGINLLFYLGALLVIAALTIFVGLGWESFGGWGIMAIGLVYSLGFLAAGHYFYHKPETKTVGGLFVTIAVCIVPLIVYGFQLATGWWLVEAPGTYQNFYEWVKGGWFVMEVTTVIACCLALYFYPFPFLTAPLFFTLWFMSMDITPLLYRRTEDPMSFEHYRWVSVVFGAVMLIIAFLIDRRSKLDFAFWAYLFGTIAFWTGISMRVDATEFESFLYCLMNVGLMFLAIILQRRVLLVFGAFGVLIYLYHLFYTYFSDTALFSFVLSGIGVAIILLGLWYNQHQEKIERTLIGILPEFIRKHLPQYRDRD